MIYSSFTNKIGKYINNSLNTLLTNSIPTAINTPNVLLYFKH